ncbi:MAG TPA: hypothetical protein VGI45_35345 [Terracidiphilus sp.]|jgi:hypothetical protein
MNTTQQIASARHEYQLKGWYRSFLLIMGAPAISGGIVFAFLTSKGSNTALPVLMTGLFLFSGIYLIALAIRSRVVIEGNRLEIRGAFTDRSAELSELRGYRTISSRNGKHTQIYLNNGRKSLTLSNLFDRDSTFDTWLRRVPDLDHQDREAILEKISQDPTLGATPQDRLAALSQAKTNSMFALAIAVVSAIAANWGIPALYLAFSVVLALVPIVLAVMLHRAPLLYAVFRRKGDPRAELLYALIVCSFGLLIRARGVRFVTLHSVGLVIGLLILAYMGAFYQSFFESTSPSRTFFALLLFSMLYGYGLVATADAVDDESTSTHYVVHVLGKHYTTGRSRAFYLELEPWGPLQSPNNLGVSQTVYEKAQAGDEICIDLRPGRLNVPWYTQVSCSAVPLDSQP